MKSLRTGSKDLIKDLNKALIINEIRNRAPVSRTEIAKNINLGLSTVTKIVAELLEKNLVYETGEGDSTGGRKPIYLEFNHNYGYVIGINIEDEQAVIALRNLNVEVVQRVVYRYPRGTSWQAVIPELIKEIQKLQRIAAENRKEVLRVGIGVSGVVDINRGVLLYSRRLNWEQVPFKKFLEEEIHVPVSVDNDVNTYALAELFYGAGKRYDNFVCVSIGDGVGAGLIINRNLYRGDFGGAGEFGHTIIEMNGENCYCGQQGCLESYSCNQFILNRVRQLAAASSGNQWYPPEKDLTLEIIREAAKNGDPIAIQVFEEVGRSIGIGLSNIINILNPTAIVLTGEGIKNKEFIQESLNTYAGKNFFANHKSCPLIFSDLGMAGCEIGPAITAIIDLFEAPIYQNSNRKLL